MEKTYTEAEIKAYFEYIISKCPNSPMAERCERMLFTMFDKTYGDSTTLEKITEKLKKETNK